MAKKRRKGRRGGGRRSYGRRGSRGILGKLGFDMGDALMGAAAEMVGTALSDAVKKMDKAPEFLKNAPTVALGLYGLGIAFGRRAIRGAGAGMALGRAFNILTVTP